VNPPTWLDERGRPHAQRPCPVCGREIPDVTLPPEHLKGHGWEPFRVWGVVEWCGHRVEGIPVPDTDGRWRLTVVKNLLHRAGPVTPTEFVVQPPYARPARKCLVAFRRFALECSRPTLPAQGGVR